MGTRYYYGEIGYVRRGKCRYTMGEIMMILTVVVVIVFVVLVRLDARDAFRSDNGSVGVGEFSSVHHGGVDTFAALGHNNASCVQKDTNVDGFPIIFAAVRSHVVPLVAVVLAAAV
jgi:hypothetical protein